MRMKRRVVGGWAEARAVVFECRDCGASITIPTNADPKKIESVERCPADAGHSWVGTPDLTVISIFKALPRGLGEGQPFRVLLEFDEQTVNSPTSAER